MVGPLPTHIVERESAPRRSAQKASRSMPAFSRKMVGGVRQLTKSKLPEADGNAAPSPCTQAMSGILRRAWRNIPSEPSRPTNLAFGVRPRLAICWLPVPYALPLAFSNR